MIVIRFKSQNTDVLYFCNNFNLIKLYIYNEFILFIFLLSRFHRI